MKMGILQSKWCQNMISSELIARVATMKKRPSPEKVLELQHAFEYNQMARDGLVERDYVCLYRGCCHHFSMHNKSWKDPNGKRKRCRCRHMRAM